MAPNGTIPKNKLILGINAGSSSVKLSLFETHFGDESPSLLLESTVSNLTSPPAKFTYTHVSVASSEHNVESEERPDIDSHEAAFSHFLSHLSSDNTLQEDHGDLNIEFATHRIVHGGDFKTSMALSSETIQEITELTDLAPLHNAPALSLVHTCISKLPNTKNIAYFDTSFHHTLPLAARTYAIDPDVAARKKIRRYGFHGLSYSFILSEVVSYLDQDPSETSIIALHLGSGCSAVAIKDGESIDTTMGLTPLEGLPGATRSGQVDPSLVFHYTNDAAGLAQTDMAELHISKAESILNQQAGWKSMTGTTDFHEILQRSKQGDERCCLALDLLVDRIVAAVAAYWVKLDADVHAIVFAGGLGEKSSELRSKICTRLSCLGVRVDERANAAVDRRGGSVVGIGGERVSERGGVRVLVCRTDEQAEMARQCAGDGRFWGAED